MNRKLKISLFIVLSLIFTNVFAYAEEAAKSNDQIIDTGKKVKINFTMKSEGEILETTEGKTPFEFTYGENPMIPGLQEVLKGLKAGDKKQLSLTPENAFGYADPKAIVEFPKSKFKEKDLEAGMILNGQGQGGVPLRGVIKEVKADTIVLDFNHPLAGKNLDLDLEVIEVV